MSTAVAPALSRQPTTPRTLPRYKAAIPLDVVVLRSGIPDRIPGRSLDISEGGVGLVVPAALFSGETVALELFFPSASLPMRARAVVRHQHQLRCGLELLGLSLEQRAALRSWMQQQQPVSHQAVSGSGSGEKVPATKPKGFSWKVKLQGDWTPGLVVRIALLSIVVASLGWWRWQRGWHEIEAQLPAGQAAITRSLVTVPANVMEQRLMHRVDPVYPDEARQGSLPSMVVLHAIIDAEGRVVRLEPVSGPQALAQAAMEAARWWRYEPYMVNGKAAEVETTLEVQFRPPLVTKN